MKTVKTGVIGLGKMGVSHLAILGANTHANVVGVCDTSKMITDGLQKYGHFPGFTDYQKMLDQAKPEAVIVAVPTKYHAPIIHDLIDRNMHIFAEKPFCLDVPEGEAILAKLKGKSLINQVGYHNKFVGTFKEVKKLLQTNAIGKIHHFVGEAYGPVVVRPKESTWRSKPEEGGGCLMDYASHVIDLINGTLQPIAKVHHAVRKSIFSKDVDDSVYAMLELTNGLSGVLSVNWSDETYRKMSTGITIIGTAGKIIADANELKVYLTQTPSLPGYQQGWNIKNVTDLTDSVAFYLRGEEYTAQMDNFIDCVRHNQPNTVNTFESASHTDKIIETIKSFN